MCEDILHNLYGELKKDCGNDAVKNLLLITLTGFYPFIAKMGFPMSFPLAVVVEEENEVMRMAEYLDIFDAHNIISTSAKPKDMQKHLASARYGSVFLTLDEGRYMSENLQQTVSCSRKMERGIDKNFFTIIFVVKGVPPKYKDFFSGTIFVSGKTRITEKAKELRQRLMREMISFAISHEKEIKHESERRFTELEEDFSLFDVPAILLKLFLRTQKLTTDEIEKLEGEIEDALDRIAEEWESADDPEIYATAFRKILYENAEGLPDMFDRKKFPESAIEQIDEIMLFDKENYYLPAKLMKELCQKIGSVRYIEAQLVNAGLLICEGRNRNYLSSKTEIIIAHGMIRRKRFVKIAREKVDIPWELTLQDLVERRGGDGHYGSEAGQSDKFVGICESR